ncbi:probable ATP-dependent RNA helicase ddx10 [Argonauta hians]
MLPGKVAHNVNDSAISRTTDIAISEDVTFEGLFLSDGVLKGLHKSGFVRPSPIQLKSIPLGRCGLDLIVQAKAGTGKTCVFTVVALESIQINSPAVQVLVLAPTREIAFQIWQVITSIGSCVAGLKCATFIGGLSVADDKNNLKACHIAVGTPGRIKFLIEKSYLKTRSIRLFVLDEADQLLDEQFQADINWIYSVLPDNKQMLALSATYPEYLAKHLMHYMRNPTYIRLNTSHLALLGIKQYYLKIPFHPLVHKAAEHSTKAAIKILSSVAFNQCLIFSNLQSGAQNLAAQLEEQGWPTCCIAGSLDQKERNEAMASLKSFQCRVLVSTDLTSRGIDAENVNLVINLDLPKNPRVYLHRIGRAGRYGSHGVAVTLVAGDIGMKSLNKVETICNTSVELLPDPIPHELISEKISNSNVTLDDIVFSETIPTKQDRHCNNIGLESSRFGKSSQKNNLTKYSWHSTEDIGPVAQSAFKMDSNSVDLQSELSDQSLGYVYLETSTNTVLFKTDNSSTRGSALEDAYNGSCGDGGLSVNLLESSNEAEDNNHNSVEDEFEKVEKNSSISSATSLKSDQCHRDDRPEITSNTVQTISQNVVNNAVYCGQTAEPNDMIENETYDIVVYPKKYEYQPLEDISTDKLKDDIEYHLPEHTCVVPANVATSRTTSTDSIGEPVVAGHVTNSDIMVTDSVVSQLNLVTSINDHQEATKSQESVTSSQVSATFSKQTHIPWSWSKVPHFKKLAKVSSYSELCERLKSFQIDAKEPECENMESMMPQDSPIIMDSVPNVSSILNRFYRTSSAQLWQEIYCNQNKSPGLLSNQNNVHNGDQAFTSPPLASDGEMISATLLSQNKTALLKKTVDHPSKENAKIDDVKILVDSDDTKCKDFYVKKTNNFSKSSKISLKRDEVNYKLSTNDYLPETLTVNNKVTNVDGLLTYQCMNVPLKLNAKHMHATMKEKTSNLQQCSLQAETGRSILPYQPKMESYSSSGDSSSFSEESHFSSKESYFPAKQAGYYSKENDSSDGVHDSSIDESDSSIDESDSSVEESDVYQEHYSANITSSCFEEDFCECSSSQMNSHLYPLTPNFSWQYQLSYPPTYSLNPYYCNQIPWTTQGYQSVPHTQPRLPVSYSLPPPTKLPHHQISHSYFHQYNYIHWMVRNSVFPNK